MGAALVAVSAVGSKETGCSSRRNAAAKTNISERGRDEAAAAAAAAAAAGFLDVLRGRAYMELAVAAVLDRSEGPQEHDPTSSCFGGAGIVSGVESGAASRGEGAAGVEQLSWGGGVREGGVRTHTG